MANSAEQIRRYKGPALFSLGFRPFFLGAALWAAFAVLLWILSLSIGHADIGGRSGVEWHQDEMLFGMLPGVVAGFLLTAVPNWTGRLPVVGRPLALLFGLWVLGRLSSVFWTKLGGGGAFIDVSFLLVFAAAIWREVLGAKNVRNIPVCVMVTLLAAAHLAFHFGEAVTLPADVAQRTALAAIAGLIALIGGRLVPSFTLNWLTQRGESTRISAQPAGLDRVILILAAIALAGWVIVPFHWASGAALAAAGVGLAVRLSHWAALRTLPEPLVTILHVGYAWLALSLVLIGASILVPAAIPVSAGVHALTAGAAGVMVLAVMTRASLGHTGRALSANRATVAIYIVANLAAATRVLAPFFPSSNVPLLIVSAVLWAGAFGGFALAYGPLLAAPRVGTQ